jgi:hypothetical protein
VDVTFSTKKYNGVVRKTVHVLSSDPERSSFPLQISAVVGGPPATLGMDPADGVDFDRVPVGQHRKATVVLTNYGSRLMPISIIGTPRDFLQTRLSADAIRPGESVELEVECRDDLPVGHFSDAVTLALDRTHDARLTVPIKGVGLAP